MSILDDLCKGTMKLPSSRIFHYCALVMLVVAPIVTVATTAAAGSFSASSGNLRATFTYTGAFPQAHDTTLSVSRSGKVIDVESVTSKWCDHQCWPNSVAPKAQVVRIVRLRPNGPLDIVLSLYSGGAHCCTVEQVYVLHKASLTKSEYNFGDPSALLEPIGKGGSSVFVSGDDRFAYAFTDFAASGLPLKVMSFSRGSFHNITDNYPERIARDAANWRTAFFAQASSHYQDTTGLAAAWAADEDLLGHAAQVQRFLVTQSRAGHLNSAISPEEPDGNKFIASLDKFLVKWDYAH
jgi:hypothetical protein